MTLDNPLSVALVGTGNRSRQVYRPLFDALKPWMKLVAVCDPVRESTDAFAGAMGVPAFYDLEELVSGPPHGGGAGRRASTLRTTPLPSTYCPIGIPVNVETSMCSLLVQAREMVAAARDNDTTLRVGENFFRFPFDRMMRLVADDGFVGPIERLTCWHDHTGYHNNSRWISFFGAHPVAVQAIHHTMTTAPHYQLPHRYFESEAYRAHFFWFPDGALVIDHSANMKSMLGRYPRPGYTELAGARGSIVQQAPADAGLGQGRGPLLHRRGPQERGRRRRPGLSHRARYRRRETGSHLTSTCPPAGSSTSTTTAPAGPPTTPGNTTARRSWAI